MTNLDEMCVANTYTLQVWKFLSPGENAADCVKDAVAETKKLAAGFAELAEKKEKPEDRQYWAARAEAAKEEADKFVIMRFGDFLDTEKRRILEGPMEEITAEAFYDAMEFLPPVKWGIFKGMEVFCFSEFLTGSFTNQYARDPGTGKFWMKTVDSLDSSTWIPSILYPEREA